MTINGILFDLDGTLLDREQSLMLFIDDQYNRFPALQHINKDLFMSRFMELDNYGYVWKDKVYQCLIQEFVIKISHEVLLMDYIKNFQHYCTPFPHLHTTLASLKEMGIKLALVSNGYGLFQYNNYKALAIDHFFDAILISEWEGVRKPDKEIFIRALNRISVTPEQAIFVGDHPDKDIKASHLLGMKTIWKKSGLFDKAKYADHSIDDLSTILSIVKLYNGE